MDQEDSPGGHNKRSTMKTHVDLSEPGQDSDAGEGPHSEEAGDVG